MDHDRKFIEEINIILASLDFAKLSYSCNSKNNDYAKEVLKKMHDAFLSAYGKYPLSRDEFDCVMLPAVIHARKTGFTALGIVTIDLTSSGEHYNTIFLTPRGAFDDFEDFTAAENKYITKLFIPYDYWYTPVIEDDIHIDLKNIPASVSEIMDACIPDQQEEPDNNSKLEL